MIDVAIMIALLIYVLSVLISISLYTVAAFESPPTLGNPFISFTDAYVPFYEKLSPNGKGAFKLVCSVVLFLVGPCLILFVLYMLVMGFSNLIKVVFQYIRGTL